MTKLNEIWATNRTVLAQHIKTVYESTTNDTLEQTEATKIENLLYNYTHALRGCYLAFDDNYKESLNVLKEIFAHKTYALVTEWKMINDMFSTDKGKTKTQESYYDVADTPRIETANFNEVEIRKNQIETLYNHSQAIKEFYNELKLIVLTIYF